ncbi:hypothetical protein PR048_026280 [Dryococelus australis]|uniref:Uncharacterized protein n=1 Tax=Dryococelus australis TaxID=614101 RepID=A0ABQ9GKX6_9NEOP|nr:hypothetical protein PR048_026280 [Dryococelus australis]
MDEGIRFTAMLILRMAKGYTMYLQVDLKTFHWANISLALLVFPLVDYRPIMNAVKYRVVYGMVWTNRTMVSFNTDTNRTGVLAVVDTGDSLLICLKCQYMCADLNVIRVLCTETFSVKSFVPKRLSRSDGALGVRGSVARIALSLLDLERAAAHARKMAALACNMLGRRLPINASYNLLISWQPRHLSACRTTASPISDTSSTSPAFIPAKSAHLLYHPQRYQTFALRLPIARTKHTRIKNYQSMASLWLTAYTRQTEKKQITAFKSVHCDGALYTRPVSSSDMICIEQRTDRNTASLARKSDEALGLRVGVARIAPSLLHLVGVRKLPCPCCSEVVIRFVNISAPAVRECLLASHQYEPGLIHGRLTPGFSQVGIVPDDAAGQRVFSDISRYPPPLHSGAAPFSPSFTLVGSQDLVVKSRPNLSIQLAIVKDNFISRPMMVKLGEYEAVSECKGGGNGRPLRKPADQRHRPARFPLAKIQERPRRESNASNQKWGRSSSVAREPNRGAAAGQELEHPKVGPQPWGRTWSVVREAKYWGRTWSGAIEPNIGTVAAQLLENPNSGAARGQVLENPITEKRPEEFVSSLTCRLDPRVSCTITKISVTHWLLAFTAGGDDRTYILLRLNHRNGSRNDWYHLDEVTCRLQEKQRGTIKVNERRGYVNIICYYLAEHWAQLFLSGYLVRDVREMAEGARKRLT